jgi:hypothetical protein
MRPWLHLLLAVCVACSGFARPVHACGTEDPPPAEATGETAAMHEHCGGGDDIAPVGHPSEPSSDPAARTTDGTPAAGACAPDCCGAGACGCPCATLTAVPPVATVANPAPAPIGPPVASSAGHPSSASSPPLRPPIA